MKMLAAAASGAAIAGFFVVMHADTPWFGASPHETFSAAKSQVTLNAGQSLVIVSVPSNKELTITDASANAYWAGNQVLLEVDERDSTGADVVKVPEGLIGIGPAYGAGNMLAHSDGHGVVFRPGTDVVLKYDASAGAANPVTFSYLVMGYWTDK
jgi:hypothetical protein